MPGRILFITTLLLTASAPANAAITSVAEALRAFQRNPRAFLLAPPEKEVVGHPDEKVTFREHRGPDLIRAKFAERRRLFPEIEARAAIGANDNPQDLVDRFKFSTLEEMEGANLTSAGLSTAPWSDDYWPTYTGTIAKRYADPGFPFSKDWKVNANYLLNTLPASVDERSPAEKYDLLVGDGASTLKNNMINAGAAYYNQNGSVPPWMGICHGWTPASYMMSRPEKTVSVLAADGGTKIDFYPSDMKALASALWANGNFYERFIGGRCNTIQPATDDVGRVLDPDCFDTNPGTWHQAVVNQIGVAQRSFILDASFDFEVWNQPVVSYSYSYFNPSTMYTAPSIAAAKIARTAFGNDKFRTYRSAQTVSMVGIVMDLIYVAETVPSSAPTDSPGSDKHIRVRYLYDLELDASGKIVGGEWYKNQHPDFLWTPVPGTQARAPGDVTLDAQGEHATWNPGAAVPAAWQTQVSASSSAGAPLGRIVRTLFGWASGG